MKRLLPCVVHSTFAIQRSEENLLLLLLLFNALNGKSFINHQDGNNSGHSHPTPPITPFKIELHAQNDGLHG